MKIRELIEKLTALQEVVGTDGRVYVRAASADHERYKFCEVIIGSTREGDVLLIDGPEVVEGW